MVLVKKAETNDELLGILSLQRKNFKDNLTTKEILSEGFVTVHHNLKTLQLMNSHERQIIAVDNGVVVGYALVMTKQLKNNISVLKPMFETLDKISFGTKKISDSVYYVMGQVCIDKAYRGKGIFAKLYEKHKTELGHKYDYCITEVSDSNIRSLKAHEKVGFNNIHSFSDATDNWNILLLNLKNCN